MLIKAGFTQHLIELGIKRMTGSGAQFCRGNEQFVLQWFAFAECHVNQDAPLAFLFNHPNHFFETSCLGRCPNLHDLP